MQVSTTQIRKLFTCGAYLAQAVFMLLTGLVMTRGASTVLLSLALGCGGLTWAGFGVNHLVRELRTAINLCGFILCRTWRPGTRPS